MFENVTLENGSCTDLMQNLPDNSINLILTDPPYNIGQFAGNRGKLQGMDRAKNYFVNSVWDNAGFEEWNDMMREFFKQASRIMKTGGNMLMFMSILKIEPIRLLAEEYGFYYKTAGVWHKTNPMPRNMNTRFINSIEPWIHFIWKTRSGTFNNKGRAIHDFVEFPIASVGEKKFGKHPTQKPESLINYFIDLLSDKNDLILDPFMGSGTTGVCAVKNSRRFIGYELNEEYFVSAKNRIKNTEVEE